MMILIFNHEIPEDEVPLKPQEKMVLGTVFSKKQLKYITVATYIAGFCIITFLVNFIEYALIFLNSSMRHKQLPTNLGSFSSIFNPLNFLWNWNYIGGKSGGMFWMVYVAAILILIPVMGGFYRHMLIKYGDMNNNEYGKSKVMSYREIEDSTHEVPDRNENFKGFAGAILSHKMTPKGKANMLVKLEKDNYAKALGLSDINENETLKAAKNLFLILVGAALGILILGILIWILMGFVAAFMFIILTVITGYFINRHINKMSKAEAIQKEIKKNANNN